MTVDELLEALDGCPGDLRVVIADPFCPGSYTDAEVTVQRLDEHGDPVFNGTEGDHETAVLMKAEA